MVNIKLIIAIDKKGGMGINNKLPWILKDDLKNFKKETINCPIIMGRKTYESLPGILPDREHIVLSKTLKEGNDNVSVFSDIKNLLDYLNDNYKTAYVIGGADIVKYFIKYNLLNEMIITKVDTDAIVDTKINLNMLNLDAWDIISDVKYNKNDRNQHDFNIVKYIKRKKRFY